MRKGFLMVLAVALVAVLAAPAVAGTDINGFYRAKGYVSNFKTNASTASVSNNAGTAGYVEQRMRIRFSFGEENVKAVWFSEIDFAAWGDSAGSAPPAGGAARNSGGALGGDKINLETKNVYVWFKVPDTSLDFTVGLQNQTDNFQGLLYGAADMGGIFATGKYEPISWKLGWAKLYENSTSSWDDFTLYMGAVNYAPSKDLKLGFSLYVLQNDTQKSAANLPGAAYAANSTNTYLNTVPNSWLVYTPGIDFAWNAGPVALSGFVLYQFGDVDPFDSTIDSVSVSGLALDLRADANLGPGKGFLEALYVSGGDNNPGGDYKSIITLSDFNASPGGNSAFTRLDYSILMGNADDINTNQCLIGCAAPASVGASSPSNGGRGMWTAGLGYTMKVADKTSWKIGGGYLQAVKLTQADNTQGRSKDMGMEINTNLQYNIMKGLDFGLYAAYAFLGDFYHVNGVADPDDPWDLHFRLNYAF